jgi:hypothetical protein
MAALGTLLLFLVAAGSPPLTREAAIAQAREVVARERGVSADALEVEAAVAARWPDASLGCPEKDHMYAQVITEGFRVVLRDGSRSYDVRVAPGHAVLCAARTPRTVALDELRAADKVQHLARADLAERLGIPLAAVRVDYLKPVTWPDADLGCAEPGPAPEARETPGFEIRLSNGERRFTYHADRERVRLCQPPSE